MVEAIVRNIKKSDDYTFSDEEMKPYDDLVDAIVEHLTAKQCQKKIK